MRETRRLAIKLDCVNGPISAAATSTITAAVASEWQLKTGRWYCPSESTDPLYQSALVSEKILPNRIMMMMMSLPRDRVTTSPIKSEKRRTPEPGALLVLPRRHKQTRGQLRTKARL